MTVVGGSPTSLACRTVPGSFWNGVIVSHYPIDISAFCFLPEGCLAVYLPCKGTGKGQQKRTFGVGFFLSAPFVLLSVSAFDFVKGYLAMILYLPLGTPKRD